MGTMTCSIPQEIFFLVILFWHFNSLFIPKQVTEKESSKGSLNLKKMGESVTKREIISNFTNA